MQNCDIQQQQPKPFPTRWGKGSKPSCDIYPVKSTSKIVTKLTIEQGSKPDFNHEEKG